MKKTHKKPNNRNDSDPKKKKQKDSLQEVSDYLYNWYLTCLKAEQKSS